MTDVEIIEECGRPCPPGQACEECEEYWDRMRYEGFWEDGKGWTNRGWKEVLRSVGVMTYG